MQIGIIDPEPSVYLIMLNYNGKHHLEYSVPSVMKTDYPHYTFIIVDNASNDNSIDFVKNNFPSIELIPNSKNKGWAGGNNDGIKHAMGEGAKYVALINNDILVHPDWIKNAVSIAEQNPDIGAIGFSAFSPQREKEKFEEAIRKPPVLSFQETDFVTGWALFLRAEVIKYLGFIDEKYFSFGEEADFEIRLKIAGYRIIKLNTPLCHYSGGSYSKYPVKAAYLFMRNSLRIQLKFMKLKAFFKRIYSIIIGIRAGRQNLPVDQGYFYSDILVPRTRWFSFLILAYSILWNLANLPITLMAGEKAYRRAVKTRNLLQKN